MRSSVKQSAHDRNARPRELGSGALILLVDNYDSFLFNLQRYLVRLGQDVLVLRNDATELMERAAEASAIVLSPGPKAPDDAGFSLRIVRELSGKKPILGVCLGHQTVCQAFGGKIVRGSRPMHGRTSRIDIKTSPLFAGLESPQYFARYHSLIAERASLPACLRVIASSEDDEVMAVEHQRHCTFGVQFHPESVLSEHGYRLLANFLQLAKLAVPSQLPACDFRPRGPGNSTLAWEAERVEVGVESAEELHPAVVLPRQVATQQP